MPWGPHAPWRTRGGAARVVHRLRSHAPARRLFSHPRTRAACVRDCVAGIPRMRIRMRHGFIASAARMRASRACLMGSRTACGCPSHGARMPRAGARQRAYSHPHPSRLFPLAPCAQGVARDAPEGCAVRTPRARPRVRFPLSLRAMRKRRGTACVRRPVRRRARCRVLASREPNRQCGRGAHSPRNSGLPCFPGPRAHARVGCARRGRDSVRRRARKAAWKPRREFARQRICPQPPTPMRGSFVSLSDALPAHLCARARR